ncbi:MAG: TIR domain-containing protein [Desulfobacteraceae bacterium]|nr:TIR domain-containing protein [Desulfobacteraceae bacterium]
MKKRIFISHAAKDKSLADLLLDFLQTGANISHDEVFCSSLEGLGIPHGKNFIEYIKLQLQAPEVVIAIVSRNYFISQFCLCELGATWAMSHNILPLLVPPLKYSDISGVLSSIQVSRIDDSDDLNTFITELGKQIGSKINLARWDAKKKTFLRNLTSVLKGLPKPDTVSATEHDAIKARMKDTQEALEEAEQKVSLLEDKIKELKKLKNKVQVAKVEKQFSTQQQTFDELLEKVRGAFGKLPRIVTLVAFKERVTDEAIFNAFEDPELLREAEISTEHEYLTYGERGFYLNNDHPKIRRCKNALSDLSHFLESEAEAEIFQSFEEDNDYPLSLSNRAFWNEYINDSIEYL